MELSGPRIPGGILRLDEEDPLRSYRERFLLPPGKIYLDGNSLGPVPRTAPERIARVLEEEWGKDLVEAWNRHDWIRLPQRAGAKIAKIVGAGPQEVIVADSISINLFKMLVVALRLRPGRKVILCETESFPSDTYIAEGLVDLLPDSVELRRVSRQTLPDALDESTAVACLNHVDFKSGHRHDLRAVTAKAREKGALVLWDLAHSAGVMPLELRSHEIDMAVGCGYKFLNGGPGAPGFVYLTKALQAEARQPLQGWMGHAAPFAFEASYRPAEGMDRFLCGTPPILSLAALEAGCDVFEDVDLGQVREKSVALGELFLRLVSESGPCRGLEISCPTDPDLRGSQVTFRHERAYPIVQALIRRGVVGDFRDPDTLRFGLSPLILSYRDIFLAARHLEEVLTREEWRDPSFSRRSAVT